ncbi:MAG TPA: hypothetical protein VMS17_14410 [Gemmataceae bacterium]|nr:hypothetical protein [Gemmataceae bacterium]
MSLLRRWGFSPCLLCLCALALPCRAVQAAPENPPAPDAKAVDALVRQALKDAVNEGCNMYNAEGGYAEHDYIGCQHLYEGALITSRPFLAAHPDLQKAIDEGLVNARNTPDPTRRAFVLRAVIDQIRDALKPGGPTPPPMEKTTQGNMVRLEPIQSATSFGAENLVLDVDGKERKFQVGVVEGIETPVAIDGKPGKIHDIKKDSLVTVTTKGDAVTKVDATSPAAPAPPPKTAVISGKVIDVEKGKLTLAVGEQQKVYSVPADAKVVIDGNDAKLSDLKKDSTATITTQNDAVKTIDAKSPTPPPPPPRPPAAEKKILGKVTKVDKSTLRVKDADNIKEADYTIPAGAKIVIDGTDGKVQDAKVDSSVTISIDKDGEITQVEIKSPAPAPPPPGQTLWERLGGEKGVAKVVDDFVNAAAADEKVNFYRDPKIKPSEEQIAALKTKLVLFVSSTTGGPLKYTGKDMKDAHKGMKISDAEFDACAADLRAALEKNNIKPADVKAVMDAVEGTRKDIVEVKGTGDKPMAPDETKSNDRPAETGTVNGKATFQGQPLAGASIGLIGELEKPMYGAKTAADGTYILKDVKVGKYKITVTPDSNQPSALPAKYLKVETTTLTIEVNKGDNLGDIDLTK